MVIKASSAKEIDGLIADLASDRATKREAAIARLTVIGGRAVERLSAVAANATATPSARIGAFRALESIADDRAVDSAIRALRDPNDDVAIAALNVARGFLMSSRGLEALDKITSLALDRQGPPRLRLAAIQVLSGLPQSTVKPVIAALKTDSDPRIAAAVFAPRGRQTSGITERLQAAADGHLPDDPASLRQTIARAPADIPLLTLQRLVDRIRVREGAESPAQRPLWTAARAAAHLALAKRGSLLALYDLRETIESARQPIAGEFLSALSEVGNESCLEPLAAAYARAGQTNGDVWWRRHLAETFRMITDREKITRRHAVIRKIERRWSGVLRELWAGGAGGAGKAGGAGRERKAGGARGAG